jgi:lipoyl(octanoyl) transferase
MVGKVVTPSLGGSSRPGALQCTTRAHTTRCGGANNTVYRTTTGEQVIELYDMYDKEIEYEEVWKFQHQLVEKFQKASETQRLDNKLAGAVLLLQHPSVYTLGTASTESNLLFEDVSRPPFPLFRTERGGEVTYHGPGQLVMYPILDLRVFKTDLHWYLRSLEEVVIRALEEVSGLKGERIPGLTGVWVNGGKVAALGIRASKWVTYHGLALNVTTDLGPFHHIIPCGISDRNVTSVDIETSVGRVGICTNTHGDDCVPRSDNRLIEEYRWGLISAFEEVFQVCCSDVHCGDDALYRLRKHVVENSL